MRLSTIFATAAFITPAVLAASHHGTAHRGAHREDHSLDIDHLDVAQGIVKVQGIELGHNHPRSGGKSLAESIPGYTDAPDDGKMEPSPASGAKAQAKAAEEGSDNKKQPSQTTPEQGKDGDMLDPSSMPSSDVGDESSYAPGRGYIRSRALHARQDDPEDEEFEEDDEDNNEYSACKSEKCKEGDEDVDGDSEEGEPDSDNAKYLARAKRAREQHMKAQLAKRAAGHKLKQASRREVVERSRNGRRAGSRPSASPRPAM